MKYLPGEFIMFIGGIAIAINVIRAFFNVSPGDAASLGILLGFVGACIWGRFGHLKEAVQKINEALCRFLN